MTHRARSRIIMKQATRKLSQKSRIQQNSRFDFLFDQITKVFQYQLPTSMPPMTAESPATSDKITNDSTVVRSPQQDDAQTNSQKGSDNDPFRTSVGRGMEKVTTLINDNIIAARYGVFATISLLTVSAISLYSISVLRIGILSLPSLASFPFHSTTSQPHGISNFLSFTFQLF